MNPNFFLFERVHLVRRIFKTQQQPPAQGEPTGLVLVGVEKRVVGELRSENGHLRGLAWGSPFLIAEEEERETKESGEGMKGI